MALPEDFRDFRAVAEALPDPFETMEYDNGGNLVPIARDLLPSLNLAALATVQPHRKEFGIERVAPAAEVTLFTGPGSAGKSLLGQQFATAAAAGLPCLGLSVQPGPAIYLTCEDDPDQLHWRQHHICAAMGAPMASLAGKLHLVSLRGALDNALGTFEADGTLKPADAYRRLVATIRATGAKLAVLDNVAHLFTGNENDRGQVTRFVNLLNRLAGETGAAIGLLGHPNKSGDSYSGSTAWLNAVRSQFTIDHERDGEGNVLDQDARVLSIGKANYARKGDAVRFRWHAWAFVRDKDLPADTRAEIAEVVKANGENAAFLRCLDLRNDQERPVSESPASRTYAPKVFAAMPEAKGVKRAGLEAAMERLFRIGEIERGFIYRDAGEGKDRFGIRRKASADLSADLPLTGVADVPLTTRRPPPPHTPIDKSIPGAASWPATPDDDDLDWSTDGEGDD